jgi:hypothetical protein
LAADLHALPVPAPSNPLPDLGNGLLILGAIALAFAIVLQFAQVFIAQVSDRTYGFGALAPAGLAVGATLLFLGAALRVLEAPKVGVEDFDSEES